MVGDQNDHQPKTPAAFWDEGDRGRNQTKESGYGEIEKDKWTGPLLVRLIQAKYGIVFNPKYAADWMKKFGTSPEHCQDIQRMLEREKRRKSKGEI